MCRAWQLAQYVASTYFMSFGLIVMVGLLLELRSRRCYLMSRKSCSELHWQPSGFAAFLVQATGALMRPFSAADSTCQPPLADKRAAAAHCCGQASSRGSAESCSASSSVGPSEGALTSAGCCSASSSAGQGVEGSVEGDSGPEDSQSQRPVLTGPCGTESIEQIQACQQLIEDRNNLAKQQRMLKYKCASSLLPLDFAALSTQHAALLVRSSSPDTLVAQFCAGPIRRSD